MNGAQPKPGDWKTETIHAYDAYPAEFARSFEEHFHLRVFEEANFFLTNLRGREILDLGSGPGVHARYFMERNRRVTCVDLSPAMVMLCRLKELDVRLADIETVEFDPGSFDGVWAYASLLHLPKDRIPPVIAKIRRWLRPHGILTLAFKLGASQGLEDHHKFPGVRRWFSYATPQEILDWCEDGFEPIRSICTQASGRSTFIVLTFVKSD